MLPNSPSKAHQIILGSMAGSDKKEVSTSSKDDISRTSSSAPAATAVGNGVDPALRDFLLAIKKDISDTIEASMNKINKRIEKNERDIASLKRRMETQETELEGRLEGRLLKRIEKEIAKICPITAPAVPSIRNCVPSSTGQRDAYCFSRRSLKMWPIVGENLEDAVKAFLCDKLKLSNQKINSLGLIEVGRSLGRVACKRMEVLVTFETKEGRDTVKAAGFNLAGQSESGMAIHVPGHLTDNLHALSSICYKIKRNQASGVKRSMKFDDEKQDVYLDIFVAGQWRRIDPSEAKIALRAVPTELTPSRFLSPDDVSDLVCLKGGGERRKS